MAKILQRNDPILRQKAELVKTAEFGAPTLKKILADMAKALDKEADGVAIAAPQIGVNKRIFLISPRLTGESKAKKHLVFINPIIIKKSKKTATMEEGCLSVRWLYGKTKRSNKATITAQDENGKKFTRHGTDVWAQIFQHETDHLDGILFTDHATNLEEIRPEK